MKIVYKKVDELIPYINNSRTHSEEQVNQIIASINEYGFTNPILIDEKIDNKPYSEIVEIARQYIKEQGGFEKFAEWGLF